MKRVTIIIVGVFFLTLVGFFIFKSYSSSSDEFCGGIIGKSCPEGYICRYEGDYPDVGGKCVRKLLPLGN